MSGLGAGQRASAAQRRRTGGAEAENAVSVETNLYSSYVGTKTPWHDGTTHQGTPPLEFMQRLAALVPRPRLHLIRCHGVLAPSSTTSAKMRAQAQVLPQAPVEPADAAQPAACEAKWAHHRPVRMSWARLLKRVLAAT